MQACSTNKNNGTNNKLFIDNKMSVSIFNTIFRLFNMIFKSCRAALLLQLFFAVLGGILPVIVAIQWRNILSSLANILAFDGVSDFIKPFSILAIIGAISVSFYYFTEIVDTYFRNQISLNMQKYIHNKAKHIPVAYYEMPYLKDIIDRAQNAFCYGAGVGAAMSIVSLFNALIAVIATGILLVNFHYVLLIILLFVTIPYLLKLYLQGKRVQLNIQLSPKRREADEYANYFTKYEYVKETKIWEAGSFFLDKWTRIIVDINRDELHINKRILFYEFLIEMVNRIGYVAAILLSGYFLVQGEISIGEFGAIIYLLGDVNEKISHFFDVIAELHEELLNVNKGFDYLDLLEDERVIVSAPEINKSVSACNVSFLYPMTEKRIIDCLNITLNKKEIIALVGMNGSGKTTIAKILLGLLSPTNGHVYYDDIDLEQVDYSCLHENVASVFQDFNHYYLTIGENILLSDIKNKDQIDWIDEVSKRAGCFEWIQDLPDKFSTLLGKAYGGQELSGGQWQQLAISRACFKNSQLIVLDEPTSALDSFNEEALYKNFKEMCKDKAGILVTHRIGAASLANRILVIEDGRIIEEGTHNELIDVKGKYWHMFNSQSAMYKGESL